MKVYKKRRASELDLTGAMRKNLIKRKFFQKKLNEKKTKKNDIK